MWSFNMINLFHEWFFPMIHFLCDFFVLFCPQTIYLHVIFTQFIRFHMGGFYGSYFYIIFRHNYIFTWFFPPDTIHLFFTWWVHDSYSYVNFTYNYIVFRCDFCTRFTHFYGIAHDSCIFTWLFSQFIYLNMFLFCFFYTFLHDFFHVILLDNFFHVIFFHDSYTHTLFLDIIKLFSQLNLIHLFHKLFPR